MNVKIKKILGLLIFLFVITKLEAKPLFTNEKYIDSIYKLGVNEQNNGNYKQSLYHLKESLKLYSQTNNYIKTGDCLSSTAVTYYYLGKYNLAENFLKKALLNYRRKNYQKGESAILNNLGGVHYYLGNYPKALDYYNEALHIHQKRNDYYNIAITIQNIGNIYSDIKDYDKAINHFRKSLKAFYKIKNKKNIAQNLNILAATLLKQSKLKESKKLLDKALETANNENDIQLKIEILSNLGELYLTENKITKALETYNICLYLSEKVSNTQYIASTKIAIGRLYLKKKQYLKAVSKCKEGLKIAEEIKSLSEKKEACECLYFSNKFLAQNKEALAYYEKVNLYKDNLNSEETSNKILNMEYQKQLLEDSITNVKKQHVLQLKHKEEVQKKEKQRNYIIITLVFILLFAAGLWNRLNFVKKSREQIKIEKDRSEELLLNILPEEIAQELKSNGFVSAQDFNLVTILFTDFKSFTQTAEKMSPQSLVEEINICFKEFDHICGKYNIEKIKTIGDSYMAAGGIPNPQNYKLKNIILAGLEMQEVMLERKNINSKTNKSSFEMRLGIHAGPIVAGIVGVKKFQYDVWGDTVNTASRIESSGIVGKVNISETLYHLIKDEDCFSFEYRGNIAAKGKGELKMYFVEKKNELIQTL